MDKKADSEQGKSEAMRAFKRRSTDLDRIDMLAISLDAFAQPVPDYEPRLHPHFAELLHRRKD